MNYRTTTVLAAKSINSAATEIIDINIKDVISRFVIQVKLTGNGNTPTAHPVKAIKKVEVVDGSEIIYSLSGQQLHALNFYENGQPMFANIVYLNDTMSIFTLAVNFGRYLYDESFALRPDNFNNLELRITHDLSLGGAAPDAAQLSVWADVFDQITPVPIGYLKAWEVKQFTLVASAWEYTELPVDNVTRSLLIQSLSAGKAPHEQFNYLKLQQDNNRHVVYDDSVSNLIKILNTPFGPYKETLFGALTGSADTFYITPGYEVAGAGITTDYGAAYLKGAYNYGGRLQITGSGAANFQALVQGYAPHNSLLVPFGPWDDAGKWFVPDRNGSVRLELKAGSACTASSTCEITIQQVVSYGQA